MAQRVILAVRDNTEISCTVHHDPESFSWVLVWSIYWKFLYDSS